MSMAVRRLVPNLPTTPTHPLVTLALSMTSGVTAAAPSLAFLPKTSLLHRSFRLLFSFPFSGALLSRPLYFGLRRTVAAMRPQAPHTWHVMEPPTLTIPISPPPATPPPATRNRPRSPRRRRSPSGPAPRSMFCLWPTGHVCFNEEYSWSTRCGHQHHVLDLNGHHLDQGCDLKDVRHSPVLVSRDSGGGLPTPWLVEFWPCS